MNPQTIPIHNPNPLLQTIPIHNPNPLPVWRIGKDLFTVSLNVTEHGELTSIVLTDMNSYSWGFSFDEMLIQLGQRERKEQP